MHLGSSNCLCSDKGIAWSAWEFMSPPGRGVYAKTNESERIKATATLRRRNLYSKVSLMDQVNFNLCRTLPDPTMFGLLTIPAFLHSLTSLNKLLALESLPQGLGNPTHSKRFGVMSREWCENAALPKT